MYSLGIINNNVYVTCHYVFDVKNFGLKSLNLLISNYCHKLIKIIYSLKKNDKMLYILLH